MCVVLGRLVVMADGRGGGERADGQVAYRAHLDRQFRSDTHFINGQS